jgi:hypothetical protein
MNCGEGEWKENSGFGVVEVENPKTGKGPRGFEFGVISIKTHREGRNRGNLLVVSLSPSSIIHPMAAYPWSINIPIYPEYENDIFSIDNPGLSLLVSIHFLFISNLSLLLLSPLVHCYSP